MSSSAAVSIIGVTSRPWSTAKRMIAQILVMSADVIAVPVGRTRTRLATDSVSGKHNRPSENRERYGSIWCTPGLNIGGPTRFPRGEPTLIGLGASKQSEFILHVVTSGKLWKLRRGARLAERCQCRCVLGMCISSLSLHCFSLNGLSPG
jgi:hypothetical protein